MRTCLKLSVALSLAGVLDVQVLDVWVLDVLVLDVWVL